MGFLAARGLLATGRESMPHTPVSRDQGRAPANGYTRERRRTLSLPHQQTSGDRGGPKGGRPWGPFSPLRNGDCSPRPWMPALSKHSTPLRYPRPAGAVLATLRGVVPSEWAMGPLMES